MPCSACGRETSAISPPSSSICFSGRLEDGAHAGVDRVVGELGRNPEAQPLEVLAAGRLHPALDPDRGRVAGVAPLHRREQQRRVGDVAGQRPALVERGGEGDHPVARDRPVGRLQPDDPAERRRLADRAARVGADRAGCEAAGDDRRRAARGAARDPAAVPGVEDRPVGGVLVRGAHRELVHVGLAEHPGACRVEPAHRGRRVRRPVALEDLRAGRGRRPLGAEDVLDRDRDPPQRPVRDLVGGAVLDRPEVGVELVARGGRLPGLEVLAGGDLAGGDLRRRPRRR